MSEIRETVTHNLKILPEHYSAVCAGVKRAELRKNDRDYRAGDTLDLCEWDKDDESFTGEFISVTVTHVADVGEWMPGYVLLSIERTLRERAEPDGYRKLFTCSSCGAEGLDEPLESRCHCNGDGARWIEGRLYTAPPAPVVTDAATAIRACLEEFPESVHDIVEECAAIAENALPRRHASTCKSALQVAGKPPR
ncbi:DUF3850 domain-containing protein [Cronobacter malonaticus]|uniref:DUF3850 domain-containing protein n=1 Tax=Cronobacter malonaticus TaxID=413503 RepID=UPI002A242F87|nr:DUF3850 domain-containing protein [Cronobacter malonaticus]